RSVWSLARCARVLLAAPYGSGHQVKRAARQKAKWRDHWLERARAQPSGACRPRGHADSGAPNPRAEPTRSVSEHWPRAGLLARFSLPDQRRYFPEPCARETERIPETPSRFVSDRLRTY